MKRLSLGALMLALAVTSTPHFAPPASAETPAPQTWAVVPATADGPDGRGAIEHVVEPGDTYQDHVAVRNFGTTELTVELGVYGAMQSEENNFGLATEGDARSKLAEWATLDAEGVSVPPGESVVVQLRLALPADAEPGDHAGGVVALAVGDDTADVHYQVGTRVHLRVAGPVEPAMRFDDVRATAPWTLLPFARVQAQSSATLVNTGNVRLTPTVRVEAHALFGLWRTSVDIADAGELLPDGARNLSAALDELPQLGPIWVTFSVPKALSLEQDVTKMINATDAGTVVWVVPWTVIVCALLIAAAATLAIRNLRLRRAAALGARSQEPEPLV